MDTCLHELDTCIDGWMIGWGRVDEWMIGNMPGWVGG